MKLDVMSNEELRSLSKLVSIEMDHRIQGFKQSLNIGDMVEFTSKYGYVVTGELTKINRKTANVYEGATRWRVSLSLLRKAQ
jgi:hypothetical protein